MVQQAGDFHDDPAIAIVNPDEDTSPEAIAAWLADLDAANDWLERPSPPPSYSPRTEPTPRT